MPYPYILSTLLLTAFLPFAADATPIDCAQAGKATERAICTNEKLRELDEQLDYAFRRLRQALPDEAAASAVTEQKGWLHRRNRCNEDHDCLVRSYSDRIKLLHDRWRTTVAYQPDEIDLDAMAQLREAIELKRQTDPEFPLEKALETFSVKREMTTMESIHDKEQNGVRLDASQRPKGVSKNEWRMFLADATLRLDERGRYKQLRYSWLDVDSDGRRDLIITYTDGGTALCNTVGVARQAENGLLNANDIFRSLYSLRDDPYLLFTACARGHNQSAEWIKINGRVYAAYRDSHHGVDEISLLNPAPSKKNVTTPRIGIRYGYDLKVKRNAQTPKSLNLKAIDSALRKLEDGALRTPKAICPIPKGTPQEMRGLYETFGTSHYSSEVAADFPIWLDKQCYIARLDSHFGDYFKDLGIWAYLLLRHPEEDQEKAIAYSLTGRRYIKSIETGLAKFGG